MRKNKRILFLISICIIPFILMSGVISSLSINNSSFIDTTRNSSSKNSADIIEMIKQVNVSKMTNHIQTIQDFGPHPTGSIELEYVKEYIYNELIQTDLPVELISWKDKRDFGENIVATLNGTGETDGIFIVCAHYDTVSISPGADDDGSGIAIVLMLAEIMSNYSFNTTIKFILFSGEEHGLMGSGYYANNAKKNEDNIIGVLAIDKVGYAVTKEDGEKILHHTNEESKWMVDISSEVAKRYYDYIGLEVISSSEDPGSDHLSFVNEGYHGTDFVRYAINPYYHTSEDILEHMNMTYLSKVCNLTIATVSKIACLDPLIKPDDLKIIMKGKLLGRPSQIFIRIENSKHEIDTANVTINVSIKNIFRDQFVQATKKHYNIPCKWFLTKEVDEYFEFLIGGRVFTRGFFRFDIIVQGINDDINLYKKQTTYGFIFNKLRVRMLPRL